MKKYRSIIFDAVILCFLLIALLVASPGVRAAVDAISLNWWTVDSGSGESNGGNYSLLGVAGQPDAGVLQGGDFILAGGFFSGETSPILPQHHLFLPLTVK